MGRARLVVLSACESATGDDPGGSGEEYLGLPAGFIVAGAQAVVGSLGSGRKGRTRSPLPIPNYWAAFAAFGALQRLT
jgi:CHAT domain-containing protein